MVSEIGDNYELVVAACTAAIVSSLSAVTLIVSNENKPRHSTWVRKYIRPKFSTRPDPPNIGPVAIRKILGPRWPLYPCRPLPRNSSVLQFFKAPTVLRTRPVPRTKSVHVEIERTQWTLSETRTVQRSFFLGDPVVRVRTSPVRSGRAHVVEFSLNQAISAEQLSFVSRLFIQLFSFHENVK